MKPNNVVVDVMEDLIVKRKDRRHNRVAAASTFHIARLLYSWKR